ncbi:MAG: excinuclease ABC subunit UvrA [Bacteroidales bacterium]|nr:excinuclease ABC subunit UvrA [Bacteroidales bacterium]
MLIKGARVNNLKNITLEIPRGKLVVITGISGSGKSSLAFDTLFAEGQRRFAESLSSYARQFLGRMSKPDVDGIEDIPPAIAIEQKVNIKNPRSTVATTTEVYDYLRLIFARIGRTYSPVSGREVRKDSPADVVSYLAGKADGDGNLGTPHFILADLGWKGRTDHTELLLQLKEDGYNRLWADGGPARIDEVLQAPEEPADAWLLVDRFRDLGDRQRLLSSVSDAFSRGNGLVRVAFEAAEDSTAEPEEIPPTTVSLRSTPPFASLMVPPLTQPRVARVAGGTSSGSGYDYVEFSSRFELDGIKFIEPDDYLFSFNSPLGACPVCGGLGKIIGISEDLVVPDKTKSIYDSAIACWRGDKMGWFRDHLVRLAPKYGIDAFKPWCELGDREKDIIWNARSVPGDEDSLVGINEFFEWVETQRYKIQYKFMLNRFSGRTTCSACKGTRLRKEALYVRVGGKTIAELLAMTVEELLVFMENIALTPSEQEITAEPRDEIINRLRCIEDVGLGYLTLSRACNTLSGGESQRINLVTAIGSSLVGSMYILDEPSIGLHPRDTERLIAVLKRLRDLGNTVIVVEHDEEIIRAADELIDMGPRAGEFGGEVIYQGPPDSLSAASPVQSLTLQYLSGQRRRYVRTPRPWTYSITIEGAREHNLKDIDVRIPLGALVVVTGVSGSGKSSLIGDILYPAMKRRLDEAADLPGVFRGLGGNVDRITRVEYVDQNPIGRSSRSNAVTYLKAYDPIRELFARQQYAKINGFGPNFFSFNQEGGRCPECQGEGVVKIEMQFMADVTMVCDECGGKRFKPDVLEVRYRGKNIDDILNMSVSQATEFFALGPEPEAKLVVERLQPLLDVGLGYIRLGQSSSTLSGGESQRVKLAWFLSQSRQNRKNEKILFMFDEPTTGLHFYDVEKLLRSFDALLEAGHSLVVVEHNPDVIRSADWIIDLGPDAGDRGGEIVFEGTPEQLRKADTFTAKYVR